MANKKLLIIDVMVYVVNSHVSLVYSMKSPYILYECHVSSRIHVAYKYLIEIMSYS